MKKILFATTALVATAGVAAAEVSVTGFAEMGLFDDGTNDVQFFTDIDATLTMTGETDGGLSFGAALDLDEAAGAATQNNADDGGIAIFVSGGFGTVTLGDTDGALDWAMTETWVGGSLGDEHTSHDGANGNGYHDGLGDNDGQILRYEYSFDAFSVAVSAMQMDDNGGGVVGTTNASANLDEVIGLGVKYALDLGGTTVDLGLGYQTGGVAGTGTNFDAIGLSAAATLANGVGVVFNYSNVEDDASTVDVDHLGLGVSYTMDALTVGVNWGEYDDKVSNTSVSGVGLVANYDLGGGAVAQFGYASNDTAATGNEDKWSLGLALSF
ncbi:porin [Nereida sp. MMG025]|uniref:porin n=1 Tax=Nereida sp. MMG025 TaxID=2909981 RepID=UPI001F3C5AFB|nr:porin [Nereida sp. MMG025]MCF6444780.1 porin [Nereida sp. MMG025]